MNLLQLQYFIEVCQEGNFTHAANKIHVTQPTLTKAIKELEKEFQVALLYREKGSIKLTPPGEQLYQMATHVLQDVSHIYQVMDDYGHKSRVVKLGTTFMTNVTCFPELYQLIHQKFPDVTLQVTHALTEQLTKQMLERKLNMMMVPYPPEEPSLSYLHWRKKRFLFCVNEHHPLAHRSKVTFKDICHEPIVSYFGDQYLMRLKLAEKFKEAGGELHIIHRCEQILVMQDLIRHGIGSGFMMEGSFLPGNGIVGIAMDEEFVADVYIVWSKQYNDFFLLKELVNYLKKKAE
jgi:DNA-binding transcriptional LysR family regulator